MKNFLFSSLAALFLFSYNHKEQSVGEKNISADKKETSLLCDDDCIAGINPIPFPAVVPPSGARGPELPETHNGVRDQSR